MWGPGWWHLCRIHSTRPEDGLQATERPTTPVYFTWTTTHCSLTISSGFWAASKALIHLILSLLFHFFIFTFLFATMNYLYLWMPDPFYHQHAIQILLCHSSNIFIGYLIQTNWSIRLGVPTGEQANMLSALWMLHAIEGIGKPTNKQ